MTEGFHPKYLEIYNDSAFLLGILLYWWCAASAVMKSLDNNKLQTSLSFVLVIVNLCTELFKSFLL